MIELLIGTEAGVGVCCYYLLLDSLIIEVVVGVINGARPDCRRKAGTVACRKAVTIVQLYCCVIITLC